LYKIYHYIGILIEVDKEENIALSNNFMQIHLIE